MARRARNKSGDLLESAWQDQVIGLARSYGWRVAHFHDSRREIVRRGQRQLVGDTAARGFPDLVLVRPPELLFVELKTDRGRVAPAQREWLLSLEEVERAVGNVTNLLERAVAAGHVQGGDGATVTGLAGVPAVEAHLWRPRDFDAMHTRLSTGRHPNPPVA